MSNIYQFVRSPKKTPVHNDPSKLDGKRRHLLKIKKGLHQARETGLGPAGSKALGMSVLLTISLAALNALAPRLGIMENPPIVIGGIMLFASVVWYRTPYKKWQTMLYDQLAEYEPVDAEAYDDLRRIVATNVDVDMVAVAVWCDEELCRVRDLRGVDLKRRGGKLSQEAEARNKFLNK